MEGVCPRCGESAVEFDEVEGISSCTACGWVVSEEHLVHTAAFDEESGARLGMYVRADDTGERAAALAMQAGGPASTFQLGRRSGGEAKLKARVREFSALLHLTPPVVDQAVHVAEQAIPHCMGNWRRDNLAAATTYAACRLNKLPLTLADLSAATQIDVHTLGHHYCSLCRLLALQPPLLLPTDLLPRSVDRVTAEVVEQGKLAADTVAAVKRDAAMLLDFMATHLERRRFPMACVGAALVLAGEMNTVSLSLDHVCTSLALSRFTLERKLVQTRQHLVQLAAFLPYSSSINTRNVGSHARTIIKLSALVGAAAAGAEDGNTSDSKGNTMLAGGATTEAPQQQPAQQTASLPTGSQQAQPVGNRGTAPSMQPAKAARPSEEVGGPRQQKRARLNSAIGLPQSLPVAAPFLKQQDSTRHKQRQQEQQQHHQDTPSPG